MKKIISLILAAALICSLAGICSFAAETQVDLYTAMASDDPGSALWLGNGAGKPTETSVTVKTLVPFSKIFVKEAWGSDGDHNVTVDIIKDGNVVGTKTIVQTQNAGDLLWDFGKSFEPGVYTIKFKIDVDTNYFVLKKIMAGDIGEAYAEFAGIRFAFSIIFDEAADTYFAKVQDVPEKFYTIADGGIPTNTYWFAGETSSSAGINLLRKAAVEFKTDKDIQFIFTDELWTSWDPAHFYDAAGQAGQCAARVAIKVFKFSYNYENTIAGTPVAEVTFNSNGDNNANSAFTAEGTNCTAASNSSLHGINVTFKNKLPAGQYIVTIEENAESADNHYLVLQVKEGAEYDSSLVKFYANDELDEGYGLRLGIATDEGGKFVALTADSAVPTEGGEVTPVTPPQTGDMTVAMFAVIAVVAMAAVVVLKKRVNA